MRRGKIIIGVVLLALPMGVFAQRSGNSTLYGAGNKLKSAGFYVGMGMNMLNVLDEDEVVIHSYGLRTTYKTTYTRQTKPGFGLRIGYFKALQRGFIRTLEFSATFKKRQGFEQAHGVRDEGADVTFESHVFANGEFSQKALALAINPTIVWGLGQKFFIHHGPGLEYEKIIKRNEFYTESILPTNVDSSPNENYMSLTYGAGFGLKRGDRGYLVFGARMPVFMPFGSDTPTTERKILSSEYRPYSIYLVYQWVTMRDDIACGSRGSSRKGGRFTANKRKSSKKPW